MSVVKQAGQQLKAGIAAKDAAAVAAASSKAKAAVGGRTSVATPVEAVAAAAALAAEVRVSVLYLDPPPFSPHGAPSWKGYRSTAVVVVDGERTEAATLEYCPAAVHLRSSLWWNIEQGKKEIDEEKGYSSGTSCLPQVPEKKSMGVM